KNALKIRIYRGDNTVWCNKCKTIVMVRDCPHKNEDYLMLSGTKVRELLSQGKAPPPEFSRPEVAKILMEYYQSDRAK
ncbi:MAG: sulfate adenylyltransferase, partial [Dehalococcoidia bacterium]